MNKQLNDMLIDVSRQDAIRAKRKAVLAKPAAVITKTKSAYKVPQMIQDKPISRKVHAGKPPAFSGKGKMEELSTLVLGATVFWASSHGEIQQRRVAQVIQHFKIWRTKGKRFTYRQVTENNVTGYRVWRVS